MEKQPFFPAAMAELGKYCMGGYGRIGVYRVKVKPPSYNLLSHLIMATQNNPLFTNL